MAIVTPFVQVGTYPTRNFAILVGLSSRLKVQCEAVVKVHGVFPSSRGYAADSS